jgi:hypothetical protein
MLIAAEFSGALYAAVDDVTSAAPPRDRLSKRGDRPCR